jgi:hypothetical protein
VHWKQPAQTLSPPSRGGSKVPTDPPRGGVLDLRHGLYEPLNTGALEVPQAEAVSDDWHHARPVQKTLLVGLQSPNRIAEHAHGAHLRERPGGVEPRMLPELELAIEKEPQVSPDRLGTQRGGARVGGITKVDGRAHEGPGTGEVKDLRLVVFKDKPKGLERTE